MDTVLKFLAAYKTYLIAAAVGAALVAGGWIWIASYGSERDAEGYARAHNEATAAALVLSEQYRRQEQEKSREIAEIDARHQADIETARAEADSLRADLAAGRRRLSIRVAGCSRSMPNNTAPAGLDDGAARADLDPASAVDLVNVLGYGDEAILQLTALQDWARAVSNSK